MPQPIANNTTGNPISGSIERSSISLAIEGQGRDYGNNYSGLNWYSSITPLEGKYVIISKSVGSGDLTHWITADNTDAELLYTVNRLPSVANQQTFTTTASALDYLVQNDYLVLDYMPSNTDADNMVINLESSVLTSYPQTGTNWEDLTTNGINGTLNNGPIFNLNNRTIETDGVDDYISLPYYELTGSTTLEIGFKSPSNLGPEQSLVNFRNNSSNYNGYGATVNFTSTNPNTIGFRFVLNSVPYYNTGWTITPNTNYLLQAVVDWDAGQIGHLKLNLLDTNSGGSGRVTDQHTLMARNSTSYFFQGNLYHYKVYGRGLSLSELEQNYYGGPIVTDGLSVMVDAGNFVSYEYATSTTYSLTGSYTGSVINGVSFEQSNGGIWSFDGIDDNINFGTNSVYDVTGPFTIDLWFYGGNGAGSFGGLWNKDGGGNFGNWGLYGDPGNDYIRFGYRATSGTQVECSNPAYSDLSTPGWYHYCGTYDGSTLRLYRNGTQIASAAVSSTHQTPSNNSYDAAIGYRDGSSAYYLNFKVGIAKLYNSRALSVEEVRQNYTAHRQKYLL